MKKAIGYHPVSIVLHWLLSLLIAVMLVLGFVMTNMVYSNERFVVYSIHKILGLIVLIMVCIRCINRAINPPPEDVLARKWQVALAWSVHMGLYTCMLVVPLSGWIMSSAFNKMPDILGLSLNIPWVLSDKIGEYAAITHDIGTKILLTLIVLHTSAVVYHGLFEHRNLLTRMWFSPK